MWLCFRWFSRGPFDPAPGPHLSIRFCPPPVLTQSWDRLAPSSPHRPLVLSPSSRRSLQRSKPHRHGCHSPSSCARVGVEATRPLKDRGALAARGIGVHRSPRRPISLPLVYPVAQSQRQKPRVCSSKSPTPHPPPQTSTSISPPPTLCSADDTSSSPSPVKKTRRFGSCGAHPVIMASVASSVAIGLACNVSHYVFLSCSTAIDLACSACPPGDGRALHQPGQAANIQAWDICLQFFEPLFAGLLTVFHSFCLLLLVS